MWESLCGHDSQVEMFRRSAARGRLSHAYLCSGPGGIGKRLFASMLAQALFCERTCDEQLESCGECANCRQMRAGSHPDLLQVGCPAGKSELGIDIFAGPKEKRGREGLCHDLSLRPMSATRRVAIIDDADKMNSEAANALLKTLEEPPDGCIIILIAESADGILPTIRSRCQFVRFSPLADDVLRELILKSEFVTETADAAVIASLSGGSLQTAAQLVEPTLRAARSELYQALSDGPKLDPLKLSSRLIEVAEAAGSDSASQRLAADWLLRFAVEFFRNLLRTDDDGSLRLKECDPLRARFCDNRGTETLTHLIEQCLVAQDQLNWRTQVPLVLETWCLEVAKCMRQTAVATLSS